MALVLKDRVQICYNCNIEKQLDQFSKHPTGKHGVSTTCKPCKNAYRKSYYEKNKNVEAVKNSKWSKENLDKKRLYTANRRAALISATPLWVNHIAIKKIYDEAAFLTRVTGLKYEVDHVIPLNGKNVCGLHIASNLQVLKAEDNRKKAYKHES